MVTYEQTRRKYHGRKAETYDAVRRKQERWDLENEAVRRYLEGAPGPVLDVPVGTGRFLALYARLGLTVTGVDASQEMLALARRKKHAVGRCFLEPGDASALNYEDWMFGTSVCVRFLDLIPEENMHDVLRELCRVTQDRIILTIRLGEKYVNKSNTCEHDRKKFYRLVKSHHWQVEHATPIFGQGWEVVRLGRMR